MIYSRTKKPVWKCETITLINGGDDTMGRMMTSLMAAGLGAAAYRMMANGDMKPDRMMKKMRKRLPKGLF